MANFDPLSGNHKKKLTTQTKSLGNVVKNNEFNKQVGKAQTIFGKAKEKTKSVQVREHVYWLLKKVAFSRKQTLVDIVNHVVNDWLTKQPEVKHLKEIKEAEEFLKKKKSNN